MLKDEIIIINTSAPLRNYMKRRPSHYAEILSSDNRVINVSWANFRDRNNFKTSCAWEEKIFFRFPGTRFNLVQKLNKRLYTQSIRRFVKSLPNKPIVWSFYSGDYEIYKDIPKKLQVLEICDDTPEFFAYDPQKYQEVKMKEDTLTCSADVVFTISDYLKKKSKLFEKIYM